MKVRTTICDVCKKDIGGEFQYRFRYWHWRTRTYHKLHMCQDCFDKFKQFAKENMKVGGRDD